MSSSRLPSRPITDTLVTRSFVRDAWYVVARSIDVQDKPKQVMLCGEKAVLYRHDGAVVAAPDRCPHREAPLSAGFMKDGCLVCPYHGWEFAQAGKCVRVPSASSDTLPVPPRAHLSTYPVQERYGLVWMSVGTPVTDIPVIPQDTDPSFRRINTEVEVWETCALRMVDNFLDITHFPYVHTGTFGKGQETRVPPVELEELDHGWFGYAYEVKANNDTAGGSLASGQTSDVVERSMSSGFQLPLHCRSTIKYRSGLEHILLLLSTPIDDETAYFAFVVWRNDDFSVSAEEVIRFDLAIGAEDKRMLEQLDGVMPLGQTDLVSVQADKCNVEWRRQFKQGYDAHQ